ncbi:MAG: NAD(P)H-binding protein [Betaproteobacteria bacterium]|nr:NAD(P)H-binding protein [Betaproteobacteria bacterium]
MKTRTVCILGGSGFVGRHLAEVLCARGVDVRIPTRNRERAKDTLILLPTAEVLHADIHDPGTLQRLVRGADAVVNLVGVLHDGRTNGFDRNHVQLPAKIVAACGDAGVTRLLHVSALGADESGPSDYLRSKARGEHAIARARDAGIATTVFRPSVIFGRGDSFLSLFARLGRLFPVLPIGGADARFQPVFVEDLARAMDGSLDDPATFGQSYDLCGPRVYTLRELVTYASRLSGGHARVLGLPDGLAQLQAFVLEKLPGRLMSRDNLRSMRKDNVCGCDFPQVFGFAPTALEAVAPAYLATEQARSNRFSGLRHTASR